MNPRRPLRGADAARQRVGRASVVLAVAVLGVGCAGQKGGSRPGVAVDKPVEQQTLADLKPPLALPRPAPQPATPASPEALEAYALGRDALLRNQKPAAVQYFERANEAGADSALVWRDLGYARLGRDDAKAAVAFRQAVSLDPNDADSRLQLARLLLADDRTDEAVTQLRLARLTTDYSDSGGLAAVVDLLLGQSLEQSHYRTAALECYENVLSIMDDGDVDLRGRAELADVLQRPGVLVLRIADLATECGRYPRAVELYRRLQTQEPQTAPLIELRLARAELAAGDRKAGTERAFRYVVASKGSVLSLTLFDELFESYGGADAALKALGEIDAGRSPDMRWYVASHLYLTKGDAGQAVQAVNKIGRVRTAGTDAGSAFTLPVVRQIVHAYRANSPTTRPNGQGDPLLLVLLQHTQAEPARWSTWMRAWAILTQQAQLSPLTAERLLALPLISDAAGLSAARDFVVSTIYAQQGRLRSAKEFADRAKAGGFDVASASVIAPLEPPEPDVGTAKEFADVIDAYRDSPELLMAMAANLLRDNGKRVVLDGFAAANAARPADAVIAVTYAELLRSNDQRNDAANVLDKAVAGVKSANELYALASQYGAMGDEKSAERVLRLAHDRDPSVASVCNDLGYLLTDQGRDLPFAEQLLTRAAEAEPDNAAYLDSLGWLLYKCGKFEAAAKRLEEAVAADDPADPVVLDHAGDALYQSKKPDAAAARWQQAVDAIKQRGTNDPQLRLRVEQKLRQLKDKSPVIVAPVAKAE